MRLKKSGVEFTSKLIVVPVILSLKLLTRASRMALIKKLSWYWEKEPIFKVWKIVPLTSCVLPAQDCRECSLVAQIQAHASFSLQEVHNYCGRLSKLASSSRELFHFFSWKLRWSGEANKRGRRRLPWISNYESAPFWLDLIERLPRIGSGDVALYHQSYVWSYDTYSFAEIRPRLEEEANYEEMCARLPAVYF